MLTGAEALNGDTLRIEVVLSGVGAQPPNGRFAAMELGWPNGFAEQPLDRS